MAASDAIVVGEEWISEHYFASDSKTSFGKQVRDRHKEWDARAKEGRCTSRAAVAKLRPRLLAAFAQERLSPEELRELYREILDALGFTRASLRHHTVGPADFIQAAGLTDAAPLVLISAVPVHSAEELLRKPKRLSNGKVKEPHNLAEPYPVEGEDPIRSVSRLLSTLFVSDRAPGFALVLAGPVLLVAERTRWAEGRYLAVDLQTVLERNITTRAGEFDTAVACVDAESLAPDADGEIWWNGILEESIKHTVGVSADLRDGVRRSIEIIGNEVVQRRAARGLPPLPADQAQPLAKQALRFLYRILFLLYAEASPELEVLPVGDPAYESGYSLDRLRELTLARIESPAARSGTHIYDSLHLLFRLVDQGHTPAPAPDDDAAVAGLEFNALRADLFRPEATALIDAVGLGNAAMQQVLQHLLLSKESSGKDRGFISYAELGINQLGAVYEGLMSYTGFFATDELFEVAKDGDSKDGSWLVPVSRAGDIGTEHFVMTQDPATGAPQRVLHPRGSFVFRLAGRERAQSASYYTPEVLTRFTVSQALAELLDSDDAPARSARDLLDLTVCEPALGSGAFAIEAVRQVAERYLAARQRELAQRIDPEDYPAELQKVKAYIALHNVYGVDLSATAVELAEISLWLDTMGKGLDAPWFGLHLRRGNSLIGCRRAVYTTAQARAKAYLGKDPTVPEPLPLPRPYTGGIHYFLLPSQGWGAAVGAKDVKELAPERREELRQWQKRVRARLTTTQLKELEELAERVEVLWGFALRRLRIAAAEARRSINVWGAPNLPSGGVVTREQIERSLADPAGAYQRLRRVMDAWNALWFWPLTDARTLVTAADGSATRVPPPSIPEWIAGLRAVLGTILPEGRGKRSQRETLLDAADWQELNVQEELDLGFARASRPADFLSAHPWLQVCERIASQHGFFHWELDFAPVFADRGGFDLQVGNPPWVRPRSDVNALLAEGDPWWQLKGKSTQEEDRRQRQYALSLPGIKDVVLDGTADVAAQAAYLGATTEFPILHGLQPDLYRCFMVQAWRHEAASGVVVLIHPETHFTDEKAGLLRQETYQRLRRHWQFINELELFDIHHLVRYGVHVYGSAQTPQFLQATSLYHPDTVERSLHHDGSGPQPGLKDEDGHWDLRPHKDRIIEVNLAVLESWHALLEDAAVPVLQTRMVYTVNSDTAAVLAKLAHAPRIGELSPEFSAGWHETADRQNGRFDVEWGPVRTWEDAILQGPHLHVGNPFYKQPNETMSNNQDWTPMDLEALALDALPVTSYKPRGDRAVYDAQYTHWQVAPRTSPVSARNFYRVAWRRMAANAGERTLIPAIIPPGATHVHPVYSIGFPGPVAGSKALMTAAASMTSLVLDLVVRSSPKGDIHHSTVARLPHFSGPAFSPVSARLLRLNCLTSAYAGLWQECYSPEFEHDSWAASDSSYLTAVLGGVTPQWTPAIPLRRDLDRRQALLEIDVLVALALGVTIDELVTVYRAQFPVLAQYDRTTYAYDANGRQLPGEILSAWRKAGESLTEAERTWTHPQSGHTYTFAYPFAFRDREADMRAAYRIFAERLGIGHD